VINVSAMLRYVIVHFACLIMNIACSMFAISGDLFSVLLTLVFLVLYSYIFYIFLTPLAV